MYRKLFKRLFDIILSLLLLIILSPLIITIIIILIFVNRWNPFFIQERSGENGIPFKLIKFKTMKDINTNTNEILHDNERLTKFGKFLRSLSMDELPQLVNVLLGDMSLIGPRPLIIDYLPLYDEFQRRRHEVKPGITGWAQVNGRKDIVFSKRFELDVWYVDNLSFKLDFEIFWLTLIRILKRDNNPTGKLNFDVDDVRFRERLNIKKSRVC